MCYVIIYINHGQEVYTHMPDKHLLVRRFMAIFSEDHYHSARGIYRHEPPNTRQVYYQAYRLIAHVSMVT